MRPMIVTLTGPSCAGKTTLETMLKIRGLEPAVSVTSREKRTGELDGSAYYFVNRTRFTAMAEAGEFIEMVEFSGNLYGMTKAEIERVARRGVPIVLVCEPIGLRQIRRAAIDNDWMVHSVFVNAPEELILARFLHRFAQGLHSGEHGLKNLRGLVDRESKRLKTMMSIERLWLSECMAASLIDQIIPSFEQEGCDLIADDLAAFALNTVKGMRAEVAA